MMYSLPKDTKQKEISFNWFNVLKINILLKKFFVTSKTQEIRRE